jgi:hypothetical protein
VRFDRWQSVGGIAIRDLGVDLFSLQPHRSEALARKIGALPAIGESGALPRAG